MTFTPHNSITSKLDLIDDGYNTINETTGSRKQCFISVSRVLMLVSRCLAALGYGAMVLLPLLVVLRHNVDDMLDNEL